MIWLIVLILSSTAAAQTAPEQATRGEALFFDSSKGQSCGTCHAIAGRGTAVGPDLKGIARTHPRALVMAIHTTRTQYVQEVTPKGADAFPAMKVKEDAQVVELYDLSQQPPQLRKLEPAEIDSMRDNSTWRHPPESTRHSNEELADIIAYIKWATLKDKAGVKPGDLP